MIRRSLLTLLFASVGLSVQGASAAAELTPVEARAIAKEAYVYGFPMEDSYRTMYAFSIAKGNPEYKGPFNSVLNIARVFTPDDKAFVTPNSDTPYTFLGLDLRTEPIVLTLPAIEKKRYYVFQMMDLYTYNFDYLGTRTTGNGGGKFLIAGPRWKGQVPKGITKVVRSETELVNVIGRTQLFNPADLDKVKKIQAGYKVEPLSAFVGKEAPKALVEPDWIKPLGAAEQRTSLEFFNVLNFLLQFAPAHPSEKELRARFARIGVAPRKHIDVGALPADIQAAMQDGMADGQKAIDARRAELGGKIDTLFGTRAYMKNNYLDRAVGAQVGIGANSREEALYPIYEKDAAGQALDASKARYVLRFAKGQLPPVNAFWSLTMYGLPDQLLVKNDQNRYLINSPMLPDLKTDADGGLTIYIQSESPGKDREANWLPAPQGPFMLTMRYYLPKPELLSGQWKSPVVRAAP
ncbi:DUF1254 domain-containing protein [Variovorax saccharolyticus]|uniref:DUF1254 domain-containing protein n=1 Tax=Variovorax saccharolyticus TaxID=3053516 RepID=UPI00257622F6|nr:DUF1254 domain-containing protein [Variovorax sp. J31P216]MDM0026489.1 DUF1254 domain-containing protein [Variovorax sp. J31P216]